MGRRSRRLSLRNFRVGVRFRQVVVLLQYALGAFDEFTDFKRTLHFQSLGHQAGVLDGDGGLTGDHLHKTDFVFAKLPGLRGCRC